MVPVVHARRQLSDFALDQILEPMRADTTRPARVWSARNSRSLALKRRPGKRGRVDDCFIHSVRSQLPIRGQHSDHYAPVEALEPFFRPRSRPDGRGRPFRDAPAVLNGVLWVLRTGAPWHDLPRRYPPYQTCHRRLQQWRGSGRLDRLLQCLAEDLRDRQNRSERGPSSMRPSPRRKRAALRSVQRAATRAPRSWRSATVIVFLSPCTWPALHRMSRNSCPPPSTRASSRPSPRD